MFIGESEQSSMPMETDYVEFVRQLLNTMREWRAMRHLFPPKMFTLYLDEEDGENKCERERLYDVPMEF